MHISQDFSLITSKTTNILQRIDFLRANALLVWPGFEIGLTMSHKRLSCHGLLFIHNLTTCADHILPYFGLACISYSVFLLAELDTYL
jgi:hypothetical protein